jgi:3'-phosphoadenosine 5'-phosphosulfate (PAPS) 3'-phosphatase
VDASFLETLHVIAGAAGRALLETYGAACLPVNYKGSGDPVTAADRHSNRLIVERLSQAFPGIPVVAEESKPHRSRGSMRPSVCSSWIRSMGPGNSSTETTSSQS